MILVLSEYSLRGGEGVRRDGSDHRLEGDFGRQGVAVVDDGVVVRTVPAVH